ncbi:FAD-dependent monooxygenase [Nocardia sp. NPDC051030]|uniref:FAD-dependent oxidoreductase n=1 Tax=Nocardia sp. NPDC051030 TaxID=3155162 RepID=UPI00343F7FCD
MVTIIGGGIAGTVLAGALATHGHSVNLYERQPGAQGGAFLVLDGRAHDALEALGVPSDRLHAASHLVTALQAHFPPTSGRTLASNGRRLYYRADLSRVLTEFARGTSAQLHYDTAITDLNPDTGQLFSGRETIAAAGPIIGADGTDSLTRSRIEPRRAEYAGQMVVYGTTVRPVHLDSESSIMHFHGGSSAGPVASPAFGHFWNDSVAVWFARLTRPAGTAVELGLHPVSALADRIRETAPDAADLIDELLAATDTVHALNARNVPLAEARPPRDSIVLCGDADHAVSPAAGIGARDAIEDAQAIHDAILAGTSPADAMAERRRQILAERGRIRT